MDGKPVKETSVVMAHLMGPMDANAAGNVHGGVIMKLIDEAAAIVAIRHARSNVVTAAVDRLNFVNPVYVGNLVTFRASLNLVGRTSMEIGVRVESENLVTAEQRHTASAYLTYVALDKNGKPAEVPPLVLETADDVRRNHEAQARRAVRIQK